MLRKGHIEQQIEELGKVLSRLLSLKTTDRPGALVQINTACKNLVGLEMDTLIALPDETLVSLFAPSGRAMEAGRCVVASTLLAERADLLAAENRAGEAAGARRRALALLLAALTREEWLRAQTAWRGRADVLIAALPADPPVSLLLSQLRYHESVGRFDKAENALYALREAGHAGAPTEARAFYRRLLLLPDDALVAGGLPRDEVEDGLADAT